MATIGNIAVSLTARTAEFTKRIKGAEKTLRVWSRKVKRSMNAFRRSINNAFSMRRVAMGAAVAAGALAYLVKKGMDTGDMFDKMSKRTGLSIQFLVGLKHAANLGGNSVEDMEKAVRKLAQGASDANAGLKTYSREFAKLGVVVTDSNGKLKPSEKLFLEVATALSKVENSTEKVAIASKLFGRAGTRLLPMLTEGKRGLVAMMKEADALGNVWNSKTTKAAADAKDEMARLELIISSLKDRLAIGLIPKITEIAQGMQQWYMNNKELVGSKIDKWAEDLGAGLTDTWNTIQKWANDGSFLLWWKQIQLAVQFVKTAVMGFVNAMKMAYAGVLKLAGQIQEYKWLIKYSGPAGYALASAVGDRPAASYNSEASRIYENAKDSQHVESTRTSQLITEVRRLVRLQEMNNREVKKPVGMM